MIAIAIDTLDRTRKFSEICGENPPHHYKYKQNGWLYAANGELCEPALSPEQQKELADKRARAAKKAEKSSDLPLVDSPPLQPDDDSHVPPKHGDGEKVVVDLVAWLKQDIKYKAWQVTDAAKKKYGVNKHDLNELARYLVEDKRLLPAEQVSPRVWSRPKA
jgi:hypothetical protein